MLRKITSLSLQSLSLDKAFGHNENCCSLAPEHISKPQIVVLTHSAYFKHAYLAQQMGAQLFEAGDLAVNDDDCVYMRTIEGLEKVDVIYRRIDDDFSILKCFAKILRWAFPA